MVKTSIIIYSCSFINICWISIFCDFVILLIHKNEMFIEIKCMYSIPYSTDRIVGHEITFPWNCHFINNTTEGTAFSLWQPTSLFDLTRDRRGADGSVPVHRHHSEQVPAVWGQVVHPHRIHVFLCRVHSVCCCVIEGPINGIWSPLYKGCLLHRTRRWCCPYNIGMVVAANCFDELWGKRHN